MATVHARNPPAVGRIAASSRSRTRHFACDTAGQTKGAAMPIDAEATLQALLSKQAAMEVELDNLTDRVLEISKLTESVHTLALTVQSLAIGQESLFKSIARVCTDVDALKEKPAKRWESVVTQFLLVLVTAVVTYMLTQAGLK